MKNWKGFAMELKIDNAKETLTKTATKHGNGAKVLVPKNG